MVIISRENAVDLVTLLCSAALQRNQLVAMISEALELGIRYCIERLAYAEPHSRRP